MASSRSIEKDDPQVQNNVSGESAGNSAETRTEIIKKKKKKVFQVGDCDVKYVLSFKPGTMNGLKVPELMIRKDPELAASWYMLADMALFDELNNKYMLERQEDYKHQLKTKGRVTYEVEVDDDNGETAIGAFGGRGRRRHRPGIMRKQDGQTRKLN
jgi:hypothetical protein